MKNRKRLVSVLAGVMAAVLLLTLLMSILPTFAGAASSGEIRKQIIALQQERKEVQNQIADVKKQYKENENEIADLIAKLQGDLIQRNAELLKTREELKEHYDSISQLDGANSKNSKVCCPILVPPCIKFSKSLTNLREKSEESNN